MGMITEPFETTVCFHGRRYRTNASFDTVLLVQKLYRDDRIDNMEKMVLALQMLLLHPVWIRILSWEERSGLLEEIFRTQIEVPTRKSGHVGERLLDFELDGEYIYASFLQDYGIDLIAQQGKLHWKKFLALFQGLSDSTKIKQVMQIRGMDIPSPTNHNQDKIRKIMELKSYYALPVQGGGGQEGMDRLFSTLEHMAM